MITSIIVPVRYRVDLTKVCIDSILKYTTFFELILVQEGEDEEITKLLQSYKGAKFVQNKVPKGFAGAMNTGLIFATGDYYCFLNNDTVVTPGWLEEMVEAFKDPSVGLVTPTFGATESKQHVDYNKGQIFDYVEDPISLMGVCFLVKKEAMPGEWDESFGLGGGEDNDMCIRVKEKGYKLVIARKSYIYHYGSASFRELFNNDAETSKKFAVQQFNKLREKYQMKSKPSVFIAVPCVDGKVHSQLAIRLIEWSHNPNIQVKVRFYSNLVPLDNCRNKAVKDFLEEYDDYIMFIDDDIVPPSNALEELLKADKDVIAPLCFTFKYDDKGIPFPQAVAYRYDEQKEYRPYSGKGVDETDIVTGGMFLVKREVMEKLERPFSFTYHKNGTAIYSEDFVFSQQCQSLGYKLYTHFGLPCKHFKTVDVKGINDLMISYGR